MSAQVAANIVALRPCLEACVVRACKNPSELSRTPLDLELAELLKILSSEEVWNGGVVKEKQTLSSVQNHPTTRFYGSGPIRDYVARPHPRPPSPYSKGPSNNFKSQRYNSPYGGNSWGPRIPGNDRPNVMNPGMNQGNRPFGYHQNFTTGDPQRQNPSFSNVPYRRDPV